MYTAGIATATAHPHEAQHLINLLIGAGQQEQRTRAGFIGGRS
jgi:molybdate transport system substrate-binding protein